MPPTELKTGSKRLTERNPWAWVPSLYFAEGIPYVVVMTISVIMYKRLGISNTDIALYTSWLYLPWIMKPLWSPVVDLLKTKRWWIIVMQLAIGAAFAGVALTIPAPNFFKYTLAILWLLAFSSATHDIAADGFYMLGLSEHKQAFFVGIRSTFYRFAMLTGQGLLVILAGYFEITTGLPPTEVTIKASQQIVGDTTVVDFQQQQNNSETLQIVVSSDMIALPIKQQPKQQANALIDSIKSLNIQNGFYQKEKVVNKEISADESWWKRNISSNLNHFIKEKFGEKQVRQVELSTVGNCGIASFKLSKKPDDKVVVNVSFKSGSKDIVLIEGSRFEFTTANWNKPAYTVFQLDSKLSAQTQTLFQARSGNIPLAWTITFVVLAALFVLFFVYHQFILPYPLSDKPVKSEKSPFVEFFRTFMLFFTKKNIGITILFLLTYRLGEAQLVKMAAPFLLDSRSIGGLGLTTSSIGLIYGTIGIIALTIGGILGGIAVSSRGLKFWIWWMALCINFPHLTYIYLSYAQPTSYLYITMAVAVEQFGYGFGFTAYMLYMIKEAEGEHKTAHFAMMTAFMALSMMLPGMWSGWIQDLIGYKHFFVWVLICALPSLLIVKFVKVDAGFGVKQKDKKEA